VRVFLGSSIVFRLWLALSLVATVVTAIAFAAYVLFTINDSISGARNETHGKIAAVITTFSRFGLYASPNAPTFEGQTAANGLGIVHIDVLDEAGTVQRSMALSETPFNAPLPGAEVLASARSGLAYRTLEFHNETAVFEKLSPFDVIAGGRFGEEHIIATSEIVSGQAGYLRIVAEYPDLSQSAHRLIARSTVAALVITMAILAGMWPFLQYFVARPLGRYSKLAMAIAHGEPVRMPASGNGELGQLGRAVNSMADALESQATVDALTGLFNLRHLSSHLEALITEAAAQDKPLSIIVADLDNLKPVNDTYGHQAGDQVLIAVSKAIMDWAGPDFVCWRLGGDEFLIALPDTGGAAGQAHANALRAVVSALSIPISDGYVRPSMSVGVSSFPNDETSAGALIGIADRRMYAAKALRLAGRTREVVQAA
jgi:diguanylate cyclase (GGDEF)-like protein